MLEDYLGITCELRVWVVKVGGQHYKVKGILHRQVLQFLHIESCQK